MKKIPAQVMRGILMLSMALPMFFAGPAVIYNAFQNQHTAWHYAVLALGILLCAGAVTVAFKGLNTMVKALFDRDAETGS